LPDFPPRAAFTVHARWRRIAEFTLGRYRAAPSVMTADVRTANLRELVSKPTKINQQTYEK